MMEILQVNEKSSTKYILIKREVYTNQKKIH